MNEETPQKDAYGRQECKDCGGWFHFLPEELSDIHICGPMVVRLTSTLDQLRGEMETLKLQEASSYSAMEIHKEESRKLESERVNEFARASRIIEWVNDEKRKPAIHAFTEGPERQIAYAVERLLAERTK